MLTLWLALCAAGAGALVAPPGARTVARGVLTDRRPLRTPVVASAVAPAVASDKKRVLLLMSDTGGGHRASAKALVNALDELYPGRVEADIVDIWTDHSCWPYSNFVPWYQIAAKRTWIWRIIWYYGRFYPSRKLQELTSRWQCFAKFRDCISDHAPDMVVSVHPLCQDIPLRALEELDGGSRTTPFVTVVTDLGSAHNTWFHKRTDYTFVPSDALYEMGSRCGLDESKLRLRGLPLREGFWTAESRSKEEVRAALGLEGGRPTALVVGGGDGVGGIAKVATAIGDDLGADGTEAGLVVVCGKNEAVKADLEARDWPPNVKPTILGFVQNMDEWMAAADCIVTKAGPGTIAEAATRGLPCLLSSHLPGQEYGNVKFVEGNGFGAFVKKPKKIAETLTRWLTRAGEREAMQKEALRAARPNATLDIARDIGGLLFDGKAPEP